MNSFLSEISLLSFILNKGSYKFKYMWSYFESFFHCHTNNFLHVQFLLVNTYVFKRWTYSNTCWCKNKLHYISICHNKNTSSLHLQDIQKNILVLLFFHNNMSSFKYTFQVHPEFSAKIINRFLNLTWH